MGRDDIVPRWVPNHERHHVFEKPEPLVAYRFLGRSRTTVFDRNLGQPGCECACASFRFLDLIGLIVGLGVCRRKGLLGLLDWWVQLVGGADGEVRVSEMEVVTFIGDDERVRVVIGSLHLLLGVAPWVCALVVTPVSYKQ